SCATRAGSTERLPVQTGGADDTVESGTGDASSLFDVPSATEWTFEGDSAWVEYRFDRPRRLSDFYTVTSGTGGGAPPAWTVKGSLDGERWTTLDRRAAEQFAWRSYTRPFAIESRHRCKHIRFEFDGGA